VNLAAWKVRCIKAHIAVHLDSNLEAASIADAMQMRTDEFRHVFETSFGCSLEDYVERRRTERGLKLLHDRRSRVWPPAHLSRPR
jgi:AraC-like DNA-binding protein